MLAELTISENNFSVKSYFKIHGLRYKNSSTTKKYTHHRPDWLQKSTERFGEVISMADKRKI